MLQVSADTPVSSAGPHPSLNEGLNGRKILFQKGFGSDLHLGQQVGIAHEVGHHVQNLIGSSDLKVPGETENQVSVRVELQADCLAGVWGHTARSDLKITDDDLKEAVNAAHSIGDDTLGHSNQDDYTHGTSKQRMRWFRTGFDGGDATKCDTFAVKSYADL